MKMKSKYLNVRNIVGIYFSFTQLNTYLLYLMLYNITHDPILVLRIITQLVKNPGWVFGLGNGLPTLYKKTKLVITSGVEKKIIS